MLVDVGMITSGLSRSFPFPVPGLEEAKMSSSRPSSSRLLVSPAALSPSPTSVRPLASALSALPPRFSYHHGRRPSPLTGPLELFRLTSLSSSRGACMSSDAHRLCDDGTLLSRTVLNLPAPRPLPLELAVTVDVDAVSSGEKKV